VGLAVPVQVQAAVHPALQHVVDDEVEGVDQRQVVADAAGGAAEGADRDAVDGAAREVLAMLCCGTAGTGGARWRVTPRILTRSHLVLRERVPTAVGVRTAEEIVARGEAA
jgi:hypothetical protein